MRLDHLKEKIKPGIRPFPTGTGFRDIVTILATWFYVGRIKPGSGTWGSLAAVPVGFMIAFTGGIPALLASILLITVVGIKVADVYGKKSGNVDDQAIVIDEVAGLWIAAIPAGNNMYLWGIAFFLFRVFDIVKPWPASFFDKRKGSGFDVMFDDVIAGIYAMIGVAAVAAKFLGME